jgi:Family of unknown function (DUF5675)
MDLKVTRKVYTPHSTIGELYIDGQFECYTLEDTVRGPGIKIPGATAIPIGRYQVLIDYSNRFQRNMPHVLDVPGFDGIRIHSGNTDKDTEGCILLGKTEGNDFIGHSKEEFDQFFAKLEDGLMQGKVYIEVV